jgi:hypothetical protein
MINYPSLDPFAIRACNIARCLPHIDAAGHHLIGGWFIQHYDFNTQSYLNAIGCLPTGEGEFLSVNAVAYPSKQTVYLTFDNGGKPNSETWSKAQLIYDQSYKRPNVQCNLEELLRFINSDTSDTPVTNPEAAAGIIDDYLLLLANGLNNLCRKLGYTAQQLPTSRDFSPPGRFRLGG